MTRPTQAALALTMDPRRAPVRHQGSSMDGYEQRIPLRGLAAMNAMRDQLAREREIERLRECIHRCDSGVIQ